jgi:cytochrome c
MKKNFLALVILIFLAACSSNSNNTKKEEPEAVDITKDPNYQKGLDLATKEKCFTCHEIETKLTGPPYRDVANKYAGMPDTIVSHLADKIISGGTGVWGEIPMTPHPGLSKADAETIVRYILLLKK